MGRLRKLIPRYSLRTLAIFLLLVTSAGWLWAHWAPWAPGPSLCDDGFKGWSFEFSPDGKTIAAGGFGDEVRLIDSTSGKVIHVLEIDAERVDYIAALAFSPDGRMLAAAYGVSYGSGLRCWDLRGGKERFRLDFHGWPVASLGFTPKGALLALSSSVTPKRGIDTPEYPRAWDVSTGEEVTWAEGRQVPGYSAHRTRDGNKKIAIVYGKSRSGRIWNRRRPEQWWGVFWLREFWLAAFFAALFVWSVRGDRGALRRREHGA